MAPTLSDDSALAAPTPHKRRRPERGSQTEFALAWDSKYGDARLEPIAQAANALGSGLDANELAESLVSNASIRATGRHISYTSAKEVLQRI